MPAKKHLDDLLDEALEQTFPASDPVAIIAPRGRSKHYTFQVGDHVTWNSEAGRVSGRIVKIHTHDVNYKGYVHHASADVPQYEIKSDKTDHVALHRGAVLKPAGR